MSYLVDWMGAKIVEVFRRMGLTCLDRMSLVFLNLFPKNRIHSRSRTVVPFMCKGHLPDRIDCTCMPMQIQPLKSQYHAMETVTYIAQWHSDWSILPHSTKGAHCDLVMAIIGIRRIGANDVCEA